jgi:alkylhydroperoxidase family enzyme
MYLPTLEKWSDSRTPQIWNLLAYKPACTEGLNQFTEAVMRGPSPLSPGWRELIAAFTSRGNHCLF